jgi:hypothetical protein
MRTRTGRCDCPPPSAPHNQRYVQVPAAACVAPPRSPGARTLKGAAAPRSFGKRLMVKPLMMHCRASHTVPMLCVAENLSRAPSLSWPKSAHRGVAGRCRGASGKTRLQAMMPSGKNPRRATTARQTHLLPQTTLQEVTVKANRMAPCDQLKGANDTIQPLLNVATDAFNEYPMRPITMIWPGSALRGIAIHSYFAGAVAGLGPPYSAEVSYLSGVPVPYGTPGSIRADAVVGPIAAPLYAVELKSGYAIPSAAETAAYYANLPAGTGVCSIVEAPGAP